MKKITAEHIAADPVLQAGVVFVCAAVIAGMEKIGNVLSIVDSEQKSPWIVMSAFVLFYALFSSIFSLRSKALNRYWSKAIVGFVGLSALSILYATALSGLSIDEAGTFRWLFVVFAIGYLVFLIIVRLIRRIVEIAIKQDEKLRGK